jgi:hypothetical protein
MEAAAQISLLGWFAPSLALVLPVALAFSIYNKQQIRKYRTDYNHQWTIPLPVYSISAARISINNSKAGLT